MKESVFIIAEAGVNHNGDIALAKKLIDVAADSGADAVKFQTFQTEKLVGRQTPLADYQKKHSNDSSQYQLLKKLELSHESYHELQQYCQKKNIHFMSTPFDVESVDFLQSLAMKIFKIPSGEITNPILLKKIAGVATEIIMSTGMSTLVEVEEAVQLIIAQGFNSKNLSLLHCTTEYPAPYEDINLRAMQTMKEKFSLTVGYSDHSAGIEVSLAAVALGASIIEKHITLDKTLPGPDQAASIEPQEFKTLVSSIRNIEKALGSGLKQPAVSEKKNIAIARKSIVAAFDIRQGEEYSTDNLAFKRVGTGLSPMKVDDLIGKVAKRSFAIDEPIEL